MIFDDATGRPIDLDLRGTERDILARLPPAAGFGNRRRQRRAGGAARSRTAQTRRGGARGDAAAAALGMARRAARRRLGRVAQAGRAGASRQRRRGSQPRRARRRLSLHVGDGRQSAGLRGSLAGVVRRRPPALWRVSSPHGPATSATTSSSSLSAIAPTPTCRRPDRAANRSEPCIVDASGIVASIRRTPLTRKSPCRTPRLSGRHSSSSSRR